MDDEPVYFSPARLQQIRAESFVRQIEFHLQLPSTNDLALELAAGDDFDTPLLVLTERQTAGRGRGNNRWWATSGALTFSLLLDLPHSKQSVSQGPLVSLTVGLAVCDALRELLPQYDFGLKWPNDVMLSGRKVCGILVEVSPPRLVVGVGINVNNSIRVAPGELQAIATSLFDITGNDFDPADVLIRVLAQCQLRLKRLSDGEGGLADDWQPLCALRGRTVHLLTGTRTTVGLCDGIDSNGALILKTESGIEKVVAGVVTRIE